MYVESTSNNKANSTRSGSQNSQYASRGGAEDWPKSYPQRITSSGKRGDLYQTSWTPRLNPANEPYILDSPRAARTSSWVIPLRRAGAFDRRGDAFPDWGLPWNVFRLS